MAVYLGLRHGPHVPRTGGGGRTPRRRVAYMCNSEDVGDHGMSIQVRHDDDALLLLLTHVVVRKRDVLGSSAMHRVVGHGDRASAIAVQVDGLDELVVVKFFEKIVQPARLARSLGRCAVLARRCG